VFFWLLFARVVSAEPATFDWSSVSLHAPRPRSTPVSPEGEWLSGRTAGPLQVGDRVRRGPDWRWRNQDGGPGSEGTVVSAGVIDGWARVVWDVGAANNYRWNVDDAFDLELRHDSARPELVPNHPNTGLVDSIRAAGSPGVDGWLDDLRELLVRAYDRDGSGSIDRDAELRALSCPVWRAVEGELIAAEMGLRAIAAASDAGDMARATAHLAGFSELVHPQIARRLSGCLQVPVERSPLSMAALHRDALVRSGPDWKWGEQSGGSDGLGVVVDPPTGTGWVRVRWASGEQNTYRWGHDDAVDLVRVRSGRVVARAMRSVGDPVGSMHHEASIMAILLEAFDQDRSGFVDRPAEVGVIPCTVFQVLESLSAQSRSPDRRSAQQAYGLVDDARWHADALGFSREVREALVQRWTECAPTEDGFAQHGQLPLGARVMRGPDWKWDEQDGGTGRLGTVVQAPTDQEWVRVAWDVEKDNAYRWGHEGAYDLMLATGGVDSTRLSAAIGASQWRGDPEGAARHIRPVLLSAFDFNRSGAVDEMDEVAAISCDVMRSIEARFLRGGAYGAPFRVVYGITDVSDAEYIGESLGLHVGLAEAVNARLRVCGVY